MTVELREHLETDLEAYCDWQSDPAVAAFVSWLPRTRAQSTESLRDAIAQQQATPRLRYFFAVVDSGSQEMLGDVGFTIVEGGVGDCGWFIRRKFWGNGYATQAARLMLALAFDQAGVQRLIASCARENTASRRVLEKCGFACVGRTPTRLKYSLSRDDWMQGFLPRAQ